MTIQGMTCKEFIEKLESIVQNVADITVKNLPMEEYKSYLMQNKQEQDVFFNLRHVQIDGLIDLYFIPYARSWADYQKEGMKFARFFTCKTDEGLMMVRKPSAQALSKNIYLINTPLFFDRYRERELKGAKGDIIDVMYHYVACNPIEYRDSELYRYKDEQPAFIATSNTGLACGVIEEQDIFIYTSYVSRKYLKSNKGVKSFETLQKEGIDDLRYYKEVKSARSIKEQTMRQLCNGRSCFSMNW